MITLQSKNNAQANSLNVIDTLLIPNETGETVLKWNLMPAETAVSLEGELVFLAWWEPNPHYFYLPD